MTNAAAIGYMIIAARNLEIDPKIIEQLESAMYRLMDTTTEERAEQVYQNS